MFQEAWTNLQSTYQMVVPELWKGDVPGGQICALERGRPDRDGHRVSLQDAGWQTDQWVLFHVSEHVPPDRC